MDKLERAAAELKLPPHSHEADWLGRLDRVIRHLRDLRADVIAEMDGPSEGDKYRVTESRRADRSYNTAALLASFAEAGWDTKDVIDSGAAKLTWRWTQLRKALSDAGRPVMVAAREVEDLGDLDEPPIGEVWKSAYRVEGKP